MSSRDTVYTTGRTRTGAPLVLLWWHFNLSVTKTLQTALIYALADL